MVDIDPREQRLEIERDLLFGRIKRGERHRNAVGAGAGDRLALAQETISPVRASPLQPVEPKCSIQVFTVMAPSALTRGSRDASRKSRREEIQCGGNPNVTLAATSSAKQRDKTNAHQQAAADRLDATNLTVLSDGEDAMRLTAGQWLNGRVEHRLDWFHPSCRIQRLGRSIYWAIGFDEPAYEERLARYRGNLRNVRWNVWHYGKSGHARRMIALSRLRFAGGLHEFCEGDLARGMLKAQ
jgi:hypothetical protein